MLLLQFHFLLDCCPQYWTIEGGDRDDGDDDGEARFTAIVSATSRYVYGEAKIA